MRNKAAHAMQRLPWMASEVENENADAGGNIPTHCIVRQISEFNDSSKPIEEVAEPTPTTARMREVQTIDVLCINLKKELEKDGTITISVNGLLYRKAPADGAVQIVDLECYK